ncbi:hypothetical protein, partial [Paenibacillus sp. UNC499MF]|uniref:hypothetical protein n=1 Tax=Paenibacillus sp. UNC499MF TaxID=1502751 RepID=UPI001CA4B251
RTYIVKTKKAAATRLLSIYVLVIRQLPPHCQEHISIVYRSPGVLCEQLAPLFLRAYHGMNVLN